MKQIEITYMQGSNVIVDNHFDYHESFYDGYGNLYVVKRVKPIYETVSYPKKYLVRVKEIMDN